MSSIIQPNLRRWLYIVAVLVVLGLLLAVVFSQQIWAAYTVETLAPSLQKDLGFTARTAHHPKLERETFYVVSVSPSGAFARAGVQAGDVPFGYEHSAAAEFYQQLENHRGGSTNLAFLRPPDREGFPVQLHLTINVPRRPPSNSG